MTQVKKKIIRRRRRKRGKPYFDKNTHNAIVKYQDISKIAEVPTADNLASMHKIYVTEILPAFDKLAENLIFIHGFAKGVDSYENLKNDCVAFLYETLLKFDHTRGSKAFSYFNVVAKNWLIIQSKKAAKNRKRNMSLDALAENNYYSTDMDFFTYFSVSASQDKKILKSESAASLFSLMSTIRTRLNSENEIACMDAIITLFKSIDELDLLNKRAVFIYMRELSNLNPKQLSVAMSSIRKHYRDLIKDDKFDIFHWG